MPAPLAFKVTGWPKHTAGATGEMLTVGAGVTVTVTVDDGPSQPVLDGVTVYTPACCRVTFGMICVGKMESKPLGPVQWYATPFTGVAVMVNVWPAHSVMGPFTTGAAGTGVTVIDPFAGVLPQALFAVAVTVKVPEVG